MGGEIITRILGNRADREWHERLSRGTIDTLELDRWTAQKSRLIGRSSRGEEVAIALNRPQRLHDGDILRYNPSTGEALVVHLRLGEVLVIDLEEPKGGSPEEHRERLFELGHAIGNQHWPAVIHHTRVYVPLAVDRKVMQSVLESHRFEGISFHFEAGNEVIPYLSPHEIRRLFAGATSHEHKHEHPKEEAHDPHQKE